MSKIHVIEIDPKSAPRLTQNNLWTPLAKNYMKWKHDFKILCLKSGLPRTFNKVKIDFHIAMPKSWSITKKKYQAETPHMQKPDIDNLFKAVCDALLDEDGFIYEIHVQKFWSSGNGRIEIEIL